MPDRRQVFAHWPQGADNVLNTARAAFHRALFIALGSVLTACVTAKSDGQTANELPGSATATNALPVQKVEDYSSIYMSDPSFVRVLGNNLSPLTPSVPGMPVLNILEYERIQQKSLIDAERTRAVYTYKAPEMRPCSQGSAHVPVGATTRVGGQYLSYLFFEDVGLQRVDAVIQEGGSFLGPEEPTAYEPTPPSQKIDAVTSTQDSLGTLMFCEPLNLQLIAPGFRDQADTHPYLYGAAPFWQMMNEGIEMMKFSRLAKGQYVPAPVWGLLKQELEGLIRSAPADAEALASYKLAIDYATNEFSMQVQQDQKRIVISAVLVRHALLSVALEQQDSLGQLERRRSTGELGEAGSESEAGTLARQSRDKLREYFSLALAHELAHVYLGARGRLELNEERVDCFAVANVYKSRNAVPIGVVGWLDSDVDGEARRFWAVDDQDKLDAIKARVEKIRSWAVAVVADQDFVRNSCPQAAG